MKWVNVFVWFSMFIFLIANVSAANHYVRQGAGGDGSSWSNAYSNLPSSLIRGDTYYVADGSYGSYTFDDSGTSLITIKKATVSDHGTSTGWQNSYGDGQAVFGTFDFKAGYYTIDGQTGGGPGSWETGFGFRLYSSSAGAKIVRLDSASSHVTIKHADIQNSGEDVSGNSDTFYVMGADYLTVSHCWVHDTNRVNFIFDSGSTNVLLEYNLISERHSIDGTHGEHISANHCGMDANHVYRYNIFRDSTNTGTIVIKDSVQAGWEIYGNLFYQTSSRYYNTNGVITDTTGDSTTNVKIYNNVFMPYVNGGGNPALTSDWDVSTGNVFYNNIVFGSGGIGGFSGHDYNVWDVSSIASSEAHGQYVSNVNDLFVNPSGRDYRLKIPTQPGQTLSSPFNMDMLGNVRGSDGVWDRGAFEFIGAGLETCSEMGGVCCFGGQVCSGSSVYSSDCSVCCTSGSCQSPPECGDGNCDSGETCLSDNCCDGVTYNPSSQVCCSGAVRTGECCSASDCSLGDECVSYSCQTPPPSCNSLGYKCCSSCLSGSQPSYDGDCSGVCCSECAAPILCDGLLSLYKLDGNTQDSQGSNDGTASGASPATGIYSGAYNFDGSNDYIDLNAMNIPGSELTISMWVRPDDFGVYDARLISKATGSAEQDHNWMISTYTGGLLRARLKAGGTTSTLIASSGALQVGVWSHVVLTYDGSMITLYKNGQNVGAMAKSGVIDQSSVDAWIGYNPSSYGPFDGLIDDVGIWNRALSSQDVLDLYSSNQEITCVQACQESWVCTDWSACSGGFQTRVCSDVNSCGTVAGKPIESQSCVVSDPLVFWMKADDSLADGQATDSAGSFNPTCTSCPIYLATGGYDGLGAYQFDGSSNYLMNNMAVGLANYPFTVSAWVKTSSPGWGSIVSLADSSLNTQYIEMQKFNDGRAIAVSRVDATFDPAYSTVTIDDNSWHHVAAVFPNANQRTIYVDGGNVGTSTFSASPNVGNINIGRLGRLSPTNYFAGLIDDVRIYNAALSASEIAALASGEGECVPVHEADNQICGDGISLEELNAYFNRWVLGERSIGDLLRAVGIWRT